VDSPIITMAYTVTHGIHWKVRNAMVLNILS